MTEPNAQMIDFWQNAGGQKWVRLQAELDAQWHELGAGLVAALELAPNEAVLDIGCGCGAMTLAVARQVARVVGIDVSEPMLARARQSASDAGIHNATFVHADAQTHAFEPGTFDVLVSRFGVMFFDDPVAAFTNLRRALRSGGRIGFVAFQSIDKNPWAAVPLEVARRYVSYQLPAPHTPGPFGFADGEHVRAILESAGYTNVRVDPVEGEAPIGTGHDAARAAAMLCEFGAAARALADAPAEVIQQTARDLTTILSETYGETRVTMPYAVWRVTGSSETQS